MLIQIKAIITAIPTEEETYGRKRKAKSQRGSGRKGKGRCPTRARRKWDPLRPPPLLFLQINDQTHHTFPLGFRKRGGSWKRRSRTGTSSVSRREATTRLDREDPRSSPRVVLGCPLGQHVCVTPQARELSSLSLLVLVFEHDGVDVLVWENSRLGRFGGRNGREVERSKSLSGGTSVGLVVGGGGGFDYGVGRGGGEVGVQEIHDRVSSTREKE